MSSSSSATSEQFASLQSLVQFQTQLLDAIPTLISVLEIVNDTEFRIVFNNRASRGASYGTSDESIGKQLKDIIDPAEASRIERYYHQCIATNAIVEIEDFYQMPNGIMWSSSRYIPVHDSTGRITHIMAMWDDITARKERELAAQREQKEVIDQQASQLMELSTPILSISETTVVLPLIGTVDSRRVQQIMKTLLTDVADRRARVVIMDITGVSVVDTAVADALIQTSQAVRLLGAQVVLTGIRPEVAQTLIGLGVDLGGIVTLGTLRDGITFALKA